MSKQLTFTICLLSIKQVGDIGLYRGEIDNHGWTKVKSILPSPKKKGENSLVQARAIGGKVGFIVIHRLAENSYEHKEQHRCPL